MRLPAEKIKEAILSPDQELREVAVYYFAGSQSDDPTLMPLVIQAFERYGIAAFETFTFLDDLVQNEDSVAWLCRQVDLVKPEADEQSDNFFTGCVAALRHADPAVLKPHEAAIANLKQLEEDSKQVVTERIFISTFTPDNLWRELISFCEDQDEEDEPLESDIEFGEAIADTLAKYPDQFSAKVLDILASDQGGWLELLAVRMAGRMRLEAAIPHLADFLQEADLWSCNDAHQALAQIGIDSVVRELASRYDTEDQNLRFAIASALEHIHTDFSVQSCLEFLEKEPNDEVRGFLLQSVLMNFSTDGIEPARQHVLSTPKSPEVLEVRTALLVACKMLGLSFPEFDAWLADSKNDMEFRRQYYQDHPLKRLADAFEENDDSWEEDEQIDEEFENEAFEDEPPPLFDTIRKSEGMIPAHVAQAKSSRSAALAKTIGNRMWHKQPPLAGLDQTVRPRNSPSAPLPFMAPTTRPRPRSSPA